MYLTNQINPQLKYDTELVLLKSILSIYIMKNNYEAFYQMAKIQTSTSLKIEEDLLIQRLKKKAAGFLSSNS